MLSADAGSAILLEKSRNSKSVASFLLRTIGSRFRSLIVPYGGYRHRSGNSERTFREEGVFRNDYDGFMNGADVFKFSISEVPKLVKDFYLENKLNSESFDRCFLHQANLFIIKNIGKRIGVNPEDLPISIDRYGNTGAATIPLTICDFYSRNEAAIVSEKILVCGFGIGLSLGVGFFDLEKTMILPISICNESYEDNIDNLHLEVFDFVR
jgi:3-oxoacyl-[acyl-carrier-protein] synthase-3